MKGTHGKVIEPSVKKSHKKFLSNDLIEKTKKWLGEEGISFFKEIKEKHGEINACWNEGGIPHPVHFREGMQVRNFMRDTSLCEDWNDHDFDNNWIFLIERIIG